MKTLLTAANIKRNWLRLVGSILQLIPFINFQSGKRQIITHRVSLPSSSLTIKKRKAICGNFALWELSWWVILVNITYLPWILEGKKIMKQIGFELVYPIMQSYVAMKGELAADLSFSSSSNANMGGHTFFHAWR